MPLPLGRAAFRAVRFANSWQTLAVAVRLGQSENYVVLTSADTYRRMCVIVDGVRQW